MLDSVGNYCFGMYDFVPKYNCSRQKEKNSESPPCAQACVGNYHLVFLQCSQSLDAFKKKQKKRDRKAIFFIMPFLLKCCLFKDNPNRSRPNLLSRLGFLIPIAIFLSIIACIIPRQLVDYHDCVSLNC